MNPTSFPVLDYAEIPGSPKIVPWEFIAPHAKQALVNHQQTLEQLAERGGCTPCEIVAIVEERKWTPMLRKEAVFRLEKLLHGNTPERQLHWLRNHCRIIYFPADNAYPIEHAPNAGKDQWDELMKQVETTN